MHFIPDKKHSELNKDDQEKIIDYDENKEVQEINKDTMNSDDEFHS